MASKRILSLDIFRGLTVILMILVNNPGSWSHIYPPLQHANWHGCTPTDLVFPFFLFIVGVSISFSMYNAKKEESKRPQLLKKAVWRGLKLIGIGLFISLFPFFDFSSLRIPGVLQRIGLVFIFATTIFLYSDIKNIIGILVLILISYWGMMTLIPIPGIGTPDLDDPNKVLSAYIDFKLMGNYLWSGSKTWDPEGLLTTLPAIATTLLGIIAGVLVKTLDKSIIVKRLIIIGACLTIAGAIWGVVFPINKSLWTSTYVLYTGGWAYITLGLCYYIFDVKNFNPKITLVPHAFGLNPMIAYVVAELGAKLMYIIPINGTSLKEYIYQIMMNIGWSNELGSFVFAISYVVILYIFVLILYRKKIVVKV
ncbi:acyltransferase family protein [Flammeovirga pacifica]|uniref:Heparan-alpha-glucosaminide N-acetyltransferase catalytic domain-containing protein n=1 Tax=Flammeovirga pacifica TaxID=915059 RepID=A0A1S1YWB5_FLAPC|nr:heparan-alpha-glucosaminide N-acetyltransferase domain-containing protein [Flammeovirga pacifica]OHX65318.1 hypothetical protein NH26_02615 [Flammeovirga pacifica]